MGVFQIGFLTSKLAEAEQSSSDLFTWGMIFLVVVILIGSLAWSIWSSKKRKEALGNLAQELGLTFIPDDRDFTNQLEQFGKFDLFSRGGSQKAYNLLRGQRRDAELMVFDFQYTTGTTSKNRSTTMQTAAMFNLPSPDLAQFIVKPRGLWEKVTSKLGAKEIDFSSAGEFTKKYLVKGNDEAAVKRIFNPSVLAFFEGQPGLTVEVDENSLLIYRHGKRIKPEDLRQFIDSANQLLGLMRKPSFNY